MEPLVKAASLRRFPVGAEVGHDGVTRFRVWAPGHSRAELLLEDRSGAVRHAVPMTADTGGYFAVAVPIAGPGSRYRFRLGSAEDAFPDPASRFQPDGPHGASEVIDPASFAWTDQDWRGVTLAKQVLYEMHVGTFTAQGTWQAAAERLDDLRALGITTLEVMPVAEFPGAFGWGYDGVDLFAPSHLYGRPDDFRAFVARAHALGLGVILDVVYNHVGPDGNYLTRFSPYYFSTRYENEWGDALNFDDEGAAGVRDLMIANAVYWIDEFHLDGLRFDATQQIFDSSDVHLLREMSEKTRQAAAPRSILLVAENERQQVRLLRPPAEDGYGFDALWNDDFHHAAVVALTGRREAYYTDYRGTPQEFISLTKWGFLFQGQRYKWQKARRGTPALGFAPQRFITFLENHDQVANAPSGRGERLHQSSHPAAYRAMTAFWLLSPGTPMFFQGQEFASTAPFLFFADHGGTLGEAVRKGRAAFMSQFRSAEARGDLTAVLADPAARATFDQVVLREEERRANQRTYRFHQDLLRLRRDDAVIGAEPFVDGAVLGDQAFVLRLCAGDPRVLGAGDDDRLLVVNLGAELVIDPAPEPLLAPPEGRRWRIRWTSDDPAYGGAGTAPLDTHENWRLPPFTTALLVSYRA